MRFHTKLWQLAWEGQLQKISTSFVRFEWFLQFGSLCGCEIYIFYKATIGLMVDWCCPVQLRFQTNFFTELRYCAHVFLNTNVIFVFIKRFNVCLTDSALWPCCILIQTSWVRNPISIIIHYKRMLAMREHPKFILFSMNFYLWWILLNKQYYVFK